MSARIVAAVLLSAVQATQPAGNVPTFEDVMAAHNDSRENGSFVNYMRGRLFVKNWTLRMLIRISTDVPTRRVSRVRP